MNLEEERKKLKDIIDDLDNSIEDFVILIKDLLDYELDYSEDSIKYVEAVLRRLGNRILEDKDLFKDASLYIGETISMIYGGYWDILDDETHDSFGAPCIKKRSGQLLFLPIRAIKDFVKEPEIGFFLNYL